MKLQRLRKILAKLTATLVFLPMISLANVAQEWSKSNDTVGSVSTGLLGPLGNLADIGYKICYILGFALLVTTGMRYKLHRDNPNHVRFGEVIGTLIFSLVLILLPMSLQFSWGAKLLNQHQDTSTAQAIPITRSNEQLRRQQELLRQEEIRHQQELERQRMLQQQPQRGAPQPFPDNESLNRRYN